MPLYFFLRERDRIEGSKEREEQKEAHWALRISPISTSDVRVIFFELWSPIHFQDGYRGRLSI